ncbi:MAG: hypothetical protein KKE20_06360 [Nanoarchaeota archaeon]|nr:hypothetical protein [Nanoarchaeota archaeon]
MAKKLDKKTKELVYEKLDQGYIRCAAIIEIMGTPKDYVSKTLKAYIDKLKQNKNIIVIKENYAKPKKHEQMFTTFVEIEMLVKDASELAFFCFDYMPSSIEIIEPEKFFYNAPDFAAFFNDMVARLHRLDTVMKSLKAKSSSLERNAGLLLRNNIMITLKYNKDMGLEDLAKATGIPAQQLSPFLEKLIREKWIKRENNKYNLRKK